MNICTCVKHFLRSFCNYLIKFVLNAAGFQSQFLVIVLLHPFDDVYHQLVVLSTNLTDLSEVDMVGDQALFYAIPQQRHNLVGVSKKKKKKG